MDFTGFFKFLSGFANSRASVKRNDQACKVWYEKKSGEN